MLYYNLIWYCVLDISCDFSHSHLMFRLQNYLVKMHASKMKCIRFQIVINGTTVHEGKERDPSLNYSL